MPRQRPSILRPLLGTAAAVCLAGSAAALTSSFIAFESGPVRPLALAPAGDRLFAVNTPDGRLEIFDVTSQGLAHRTSVAVGVEPVAVAVRDAGEVWVVNHLSDSVSVVDVAAEPPRVVRTLLVGDEPRDVVFAGPGRRRAFVTTAHRGQRRSDPALAAVPGAGDPRLTTPGVGRADLWVFDAAHPGEDAGGVPLAIVELFGDTPRALAVSADGGTVYAAVFLSGNGTTTVPEPAVCDGFGATAEADACPDQVTGAPGGLPGPRTNHAGAPAPETGLIVRHDPSSGAWRDGLGRDWSKTVRFALPDLDVFAIDAAALTVVAAYPHVGTVLFNMAANPVSGALYVSNTEAHNEVRFEGEGVFGGSTVQGHLAEARITVIEAGAVRPRHLNKHLDYGVRPAPPEARRASLATPLDLAVSSDGETLYVAAFGSGRVGVLRTAELEADSFDPRAASSGYLELGGGPCGLALDEPRRRLYVLRRFDNAVSAVDLERRVEVERHALPNPEPATVVAGRPLLYDAATTSSNGEASCAGCHVFGDLDGLAWDLGDPDADVMRNPLPIVREAEAAALVPPINGTGDPRVFHPMKGPMTTQTLRGLADTGAMHWRGDRSNGFFGVDPFDTDLSLRNFTVAFPDLLGSHGRLSRTASARLAAFLQQLFLPPNPLRRLDNTLTPDQEAGRVLFETRLLDAGVGVRRCRNCHVLDAGRGRYGASGPASFQGQTQIFKIPQLRNLYQKVGMFGSPATAFTRFAPSPDEGPQVRGFGFLHDGSVDTLFRFLSSRLFNDDPAGHIGFRDDVERRQLEQFLLAFDSELAPVVGQQITVGAPPRDAALARVALLIERAGTPFLSKALGGSVTECDLVVRGVVDGELFGALYRPVTRRFDRDRRAAPSLDREALLALAGGETPLTFTCVPPGSGERLAFDRDGDGFRDGDERDAGSDPADAASTPPPLLTIDPEAPDFGVVPVAGAATRAVTFRNTGWAELRLSPIRVAGRAFHAVDDGCSATGVPPGGSCSLTVRFTPPAAGEHRGRAFLSSNDPRRPRIVLHLRGEGAAP